MTEEYNKNLLDYLCGNLSQETGNNTPILSDMEYRETDLINEIRTLFPSGFEQKQYVFARDGKGNYNGNIILYGVNKANYNSVIILLDNKLTILKIFTAYESGTLLNKIEYLDVAEDGNVYFIERTEATAQHPNGVLRFVLSNNISVADINTGDYKLILRNSYDLQGDLQNANSIFKVVKLYGAPSYFIVSDDPEPVKACLFTINVGSENEWEYYTISGSAASGFELSDVYATNAENNLVFSILGYRYSSGVPAYIGRYTAGSEENTMVYNDLFEIYQYFFPEKNRTGIIDAKANIINQDQFYIIMAGWVNNEEYPTRVNEAIEVCYFDNGEINSYYKDIFSNSESNEAGIEIIFNNILLNGNLFINYSFSDVIPVEEEINEYDNYIVFINKYGKYDNARIGTAEPSTLEEFNVMAISNQYNLYEINYVLRTDRDPYNHYFNMIYNDTNYNGEPFTDYKSLIPNSAILYNNNEPIFARNLYNLVNINNTNLSILNIPNSSLNDITIQNENLLSYNNNIISENNTIIEKNIYENLFINWYNSVIISNENNIDNIIQNLPGATRLSQSIININNDYNNAKMNKYRINYADNTSQVFNCIFYKIGNYYTTKITIYTQKEILNIEFISNDENTVYQTLNNLNLDLNKLYVIRQDVYIDNKIAPNELYYGDDEVYYQEEKVYY